ncbi:MAG: galactokinase [Candidatus Acidiferrales bacterium]
MDPISSNNISTAEVSTATMAARLRIEFRKRYGRDPRLFRAPGRVNLIGEHTDYSEGYVMPLAIDLHAWVAAAPRDDDRIRVYSVNVGETAEIVLAEPAPNLQGHWSAYILGVAAVLHSTGMKLRGADLLVHGNVPMGAGLSSSASVEVASGFAMLSISGLAMPPEELAKICQRAENECAGAMVGIMDQMMACCGRENYALMLDCRTLGYQLLPLFRGAQFVVCNSMVKHDHAANEYNQRRADCETAAQLLSAKLAGIRTLRDLSPDQLERLRSELPTKVYRRARHVVSENARVLAARVALEKDDPELFGALMKQSHASLRDDYNVSCAELDTLVELASQAEGVYGSRMTGGGFGGCSISLVASGRVDSFKRKMAEQYHRATKLTPDVYSFRASDGAQEVIA